jgi:hypothetical protein
MVKGLLTTIIVLTHFLSFSQNVSIKAEYNDFRIASDMAVTPDHDIFICGYLGTEPMLMKLDSAGNELWVKQYPQSEPGFSFNKMIRDSKNNIYLFASRKSYHENSFVMKVDADGQLIWKSDSLPGYYTSEVPWLNMMLKGEVLTVIHDSRTVSDPHAPMISQFSTSTGDILNQSPQLIDVGMPYKFDHIPFIDGKWVLSNQEGVLKVSPDGSSVFNHLGDSIPGKIACARGDGFISYNNEIDWSGIYPTTEGVVYWYSKNWQKDFEVNLWPDSLSHFPDTISNGVSKLIPNKYMGVVGVSGTHNRAKNERISSFFQLNPDDGSVVNEVLISNKRSVNMLQSVDSVVYAVGQTSGLSHLGIRLYKIQFPKLEYNSVIILDEERVSLDVEVNVYPNPSTGQIVISCDKGIEKIDVFSSDGRLVKSYNTASFLKRITIEQSGVYLVKVTSRAGKEVIKKVIITD